ncbi:MAG TPA: TfuA-like protein [Polyangium sp.]|nr:TfuA-like protein [Polyangium sp.]
MSAYGRIIVFTGPTLSATEVRQVLGTAEVRPPIAAGQLWDMALKKGDVVAIIDGYYFQQRSVRHKELITLIDRGVIVAGAASIGALRAAELEPFGMIGVGRVYDWYRRGHVVGDDEVAIVHSSADRGFKPFTEALVNIRAALEDAVTIGILSSARAHRIIEAITTMPFTHRTTDAIKAKLEILGDGLERDFIRIWGAGTDIKSSDARLLLQLIRDKQLPMPNSSVHDTHLQATDVTRTSVHVNWQLAEAGAFATDGSYISDALMVACARMLAPDFPRLHRAVALSAALYDASISQANDTQRPESEVFAIADLLDNPNLTEAQVAALVALFKARGLIDHVEQIPQLTQSWRLPNESQTLPEMIATFVARTHTAPWRTTHTAAAMYKLGLAARFRDIASRAVRLNEQIGRRRADFRPECIAADKVISWCKTQWLEHTKMNGQTPTEPPWPITMANRGYIDEKYLLKALREIFAYATLRADQEPDLMLFPTARTDAHGRASTHLSQDDVR